MKQNNEWIEWVWTAEKPYPETLDTMVYIKCNDGYEETDDYKPDNVSWWIKGIANGDNIWEPDHFGAITHYKLA